MVSAIDREPFGARALHEARVVAHFPRIAGDRIDMRHHVEIDDASRSAA
jgi:hypothetical protein